MGPSLMQMESKERRKPPIATAWQRVIFCPSPATHSPCNSHRGTQKVCEVLAMMK